MSLRFKKVLITAGPTWVPIDSVRVISNTASGATGILLAQSFSRLGAKVTLVLGPVGEVKLAESIKVIRFKFFKELKDILVFELRRTKYDTLIHSAAVSDYQPARPYNKKIKSGIKNLKLELMPTEKLIDLIKKIDRNIFLVGFKFEPRAGQRALMRSAKNLIQRASCGLVVANTLRNNKYSAFVAGPLKKYIPVSTKKNLVKMLCALIDRRERCLI
ncbi:MAG: hypothetical protein COV72_01440 [Candidatus Omnitrophica bacterium CG11_big_fil_rev_8_21_14_0_20_42_13]|uniref:DNA/pantothenate metabolism flavoprotein C-terminal domain-containing protein n=1 Tax=Candidatus Ghiorseimicrobium undicola TaxID=1974746 RepID=A0A2H0LZ80_9BACT|nr:MAG: hypothetical protein COV72_01440 [Candidatus Omnitrophica bacterium CG11_big_fil_rev_8_21_14_0_20_42_13]